MNKYTALTLLIIVCLFSSCSKKNVAEEASKPPEESLPTAPASDPTLTAPSNEEKYASTLDIVEFKDLDQKPAPIRVVKPLYPSVLFKDNIEGSATLVFVVNEAGFVEDIREESYTHPEFAQYAADALSHWRFPVLTKNGHPTKVRLRLEFPFVLPSRNEQASAAETTQAEVSPPQ